MRWLLQRLARLPFGPDTQRAIEETVADALIESEDAHASVARLTALARGLAAITRVISLAIASFTEGEHPMRFLGHDITSAARRLKHSPLYTLFSIVTLALAIGASTSVYALVDAVIVQRQPVSNFARVVNIYHSDPRSMYGRQEISWPDLEDLCRDQKSFVAVAAWHRFPYAIVTENGAAQMIGESVTGDYFRIMDARPLFGRTLTPADDQPGAPPVIVLSAPTWQRFFAGSADAVGQFVKIGGVKFEVVGVMPAAFLGSDMPVIAPTPFWIPVSAESGVGRISGYLRPDNSDREDRKWMVKARLRDDATLEEAQAEITTIARRLDASVPIGTNLEPRFRDPNSSSRRWAVVPMKDIYLHESMHRMVVPMLSLLLGMVVLVLLVACSNLANLTLARMARRGQEVAIRLALGASRLRLIREQFVEGAILACAGWILGIAIARSLLPLLGASTELNASMTMTLQLHPQLNAPVLIASLIAALLALAVSALGPALRFSRRDVRTALVADAASTSAPRWRTRGTLIVGQVMVSTVLLSIAAVCVNQIRHSNDIHPGFELDRLATATYDFSFNHTDEARVRQEISALSDQVARRPGVESVALTTGLSIGITNPGANVFSLDRPYVPEKYYGHLAALLISSPSIFKTLGVRIVAGEAFNDRNNDGTLTAVVSDGLARTLFPSADAAVGQQIQYQRRRWAGDPDHPVLTLTVIGVAADTDVGQLGRRTGGTLYLPMSQHYEPKWTVVARASGDPSLLVTDIKTAMRNIDREVAVASAGTGMTLAGPSVLVYQVAAGIAGMLGVFALLLAASGLYGVIADVVSRRTREIGIRIALGAERDAVLRMVLFEGLRPVVIGLTLGVGIAALVRMGMRPLFERLIPTSDASTVALGLLPLVVAAVVACLIPARRAARVDPNVALRDL